MNPENWDLLILERNTWRSDIKVAISLGKSRENGGWNSDKQIAEEFQLCCPRSCFCLLSLQEC